MLARLAAYSYRRRRLIVITWIALVILAVGGSTALAGKWTNTGRLPGTDSQAAFDVLHRQFPAQAGEEDQVVFDHVSAHHAAVSEYLARLAHERGVTTVGPLRSAPQGDIAAAAFVMAAGTGDHPATVARSVTKLADPLRRQGMTAAFSGNSFQGGSAPSSEVVGIAAALVVLLIVLGSVLAAGMPIVVALAAIGTAVPLIGVLARVIPTPDFAPQVAAMIGLGVGIDYTLLLITRYRAALAHGLPQPLAVEEAATSAGRSVVLAGCTVMVSLLGLLLMGLNIFNGLAVATAFTVAIAVAAALTLVPALLGLAGGRIRPKSSDRRCPRAPRPCRPHVAAPSGYR
jgi:RND superfamily putative drug exporter